MSSESDDTTETASSDAGGAPANSATTDADGGYVHTPGEAGGPQSSVAPAADSDTFGRAGWVLTIMLVLCLLVIPGIIYLYPYFLGSFGLSFFGAYLVLPLLPAGLLGLVAVWSMTAATHEE